MAQLSLHFIDIPISQQSLWETLHPEQQQLIVETLARLLLKAVADPLRVPVGTPKEKAND
jgi:hypothetical protein